MKKSPWKILFFTILCVLAANTNTIAATQPIAVVVKVSGTVKVQRNKKKITINGRFPLLPGDKLKVKKGSWALLLYTNASSVKVVKDMVIPSECPEPDKGKKTSTGKTAKTLMTSISRGDEAIPAGHRASVDDKYIQILTYFNTNVLNTDTPLKWESNFTDAQYTVTIRVFDNNEVIFQKQTSENTITIPDTLKTGVEYTVTVSAEPDEDTKDAADNIEEGISTIANFLVLDKEAAAHIKKQAQEIRDTYNEGTDLIIRSLLLSELYKQNGLFMDAENELKKLIETGEDDIYNHKLLAQIYDKTGNDLLKYREIDLIKELEETYRWEDS